ncbi:unnamed protein product, partial [Porites lobata]
ELREAKRGKADTTTQRGSSSSVYMRKSLQMGPGITPTLPGRDSDEAPVQKQVRILPKPLQPAPVVEPSQEVPILAKTGLRNCELSSRIRTMGPEESEEIIAAANTSNSYILAEAVMKIPSLRNAVKGLYLKLVDEQCSRLCLRTTAEPSVLRVPSAQHKNLVEFKWEAILKEMEERAPDVLDFLVAMAIPKLKGNDGRQVIPLCTAYGILMNVRCRELSLVQKINAVVLAVGNATKRTFERMNKSCIAQSRESLRNIMDSLGSNLASVVKANVESGQDLRVVFDNLDFRILANIILRNHRNSDMHWIAHYVTFERVSSRHLDDSKPIVSDIKDFDNINYLMSKDELEWQRNDYIILVARVLLEFFPSLGPLRDVVPSHILHRYSSQMAGKSCVVGLPVVPFNQSKVGDVCQYLQWLEDFFSKVFTTQDESPAADSSASQNQHAASSEMVLEKIRVPLAGDLLGRERVTSAKKTRLGCDSSVERFDNIVECPALWHAKQSFLSYVWEQLYNNTSIGGRDIGTLYHLRQHFRLVNVSNKVQKNYKSAESLMLSTTKAYLCSAFMKWAGLQTLDDKPVNLPKLPSETDSAEVKKDFLHKHIGKFVDEFVLVEFDVERAWKEASQECQEQQRTPLSAAVLTSQSLGSFQQPLLQPRNSVNTVSQQTIAVQQPLLQPRVAVNTVSQQTGKYIQHKLVSVCNVTAQIDFFLSLPFNFLLQGQVVVLVQSVEGQSSYDVLAVGKVSGVATSDLVPVLVAFVQPKAAHLLSVGQVVLWPKTLVAVYGEQAQKEPVPAEIISPVSSIPTSSTEDRRMNYGLQVLQLGVFLMQLNDTEAEGDGERSLRNWKMLMLYFRSRTQGMKYAFESMRFITFVKGLYSERMAHRILHGQFVNAKGGKGNNYANDLKMEHIVRNDKGILKGMCGNKTLKAVQRSTASSFLLNEIVKQYDKVSNIAPESTSHTHACTCDDVREMINIISGQKTFDFQPGRNINSFPSISKSPLDQLDVFALHAWLTRHKKRLAANPYSCDDSGCEDDDQESADEEEEE